MRRNTETRQNTKRVNAHKSKKDKEAQAALDYLVSWGWVLIIIVLVLVILFALGVFKVPAAPTIISGFQGITMQAAEANSTMLVIGITNNYNQFVNITGVTVNINGNTYTSFYCLDSILSTEQSTLCRVPVSIPTSSYLLKVEISFTPYKSSIYEVSNGTVSSTLISGSILMNNQLTYFVEKGLPDGSTFTVNYNTSTNSTTVSSTKDSVSFDLPFGNYYFSVPAVTYQGCVLTPSPSSGYYSTGLEEMIAFTSNCVKTTFTETGLPSGYTWTVTYDSTTNNTDAPNNIIFITTTGTSAYPYSVPTLTNSSSTPDCTTTYTPSPSSGTAEAGSTVSIAFSAQTSCTTTFTESGLPSGYTWTVTYDSTTNNANAPSDILFPTTTSGSSIPTYSYSVPTLTNSSSTLNCKTTYTPSSSSGTAEAGSTVSITFSAQTSCTTTFTEKDLPPAVSSVIKNISIGSESEPSGVAYDSANNLIYVANYYSGYDSGTVSVINPSTESVIATITVGGEPDAVGYDSANNLIYVANEVSSTVSVIFP